MNFKITKGKIITSILIPVLIWAAIILFGQSLSKIDLITGFLAIHNIGNIFAFGNIALFVIEVIIIYLIVSIFQKKKIISQTSQLVQAVVTPALAPAQ